MRTRLKNLQAAVTVAVLAAGSAVLIVTPAGPAAATGDKLTGIDHVENSSQQPATASRKTATVDCPGNTYVVGTGFSAGDFGGNVRIEDVVPSAHSVTVWANIDEDGPNNTSWALTARAVCADQPPGWQIVPALSNNSSSYKTGVAHCPEVNGVQKVAIGAGFELPNTTGQLALTDLRPTTDSVSATVYEDDTGYGSNWTVTTYAICSYELDGLAIEDRNVGAGSQAETVTCSPSKVAIGAAGHFEGGDGNVFLTNLNAYTLTSFNPDISGTTTQGNDDDNGTALPYDMTGVALCVST